ncbi:hypothetical protein G7068_07135 [Leucobacter viscericola]|uniref:SLH domain-containing protein n=1 Tax=Leucobacter viscericola TaxID=2714935 RepID=A0A6G7XF48_9MICO|nr:M12 family metallo-peptidase [Leucobacter viscericola]QIK62991.1 hypothetical protein G7068_07135 [Leucobacter viscericola]
MQTIEQFEAGEKPATSESKTIVATEQIGLVEVDTEKSQGALESGDTFSGEVELPSAVVEAMSDKIASEGPLTETAVAESVADATMEGGGLLVASGVGVEDSNTAADETGADTDLKDDGSAQAALVKKSHPVHIRYFGGNAAAQPTKTEMQTLVKGASSYWNVQTNGIVPSLPEASYKVMSNSNNCDQYALWNQAIHDLGYSNAYAFLTSGQHLAIFVNNNCSGPTVGLALMSQSQTIHQGGVTWVDLGKRGGQPVSDMLQPFAHEIGHTFGLAHSDARQCPNPKFDVAVPASTGRPSASTGCQDIDYGDYISVMGPYYQGWGKVPAVLPIAQKNLLGVTTSSMLREVNASGSAVQTFTINAASATSGVRGLRVATPSPGRTLYVEYRNGTGQDRGLKWSTNLLTNGTDILGPGVRVMNGDKVFGSRDVVLSPWFSGKRWQGMRAGHSVMPYGDTARVVVQSASGATATVRIEYKGFKDGGKVASTSVKEGGSLIAGKTLTAKLTGKWAVTYGTAPSKVSDRYQWLRNGSAIKGATGASYRTTAADINQKITVNVKPYAAGWVSGKGATSATRTVVSPPFIDVLYGQKFYNEINWMKSSGTSTGTRTAKGAVYAPKANVTREAMAAFLYRMNAPKNYKAPAKSPFVDVQKGQKFYKEISWMYTSGLSTGTMRNGQRFYDPKAAVSREAMAAFMYRMQKPKGYKAPSTSPFADVRKGQKFYKEITWMYKSGLSTGTRQPSGKPVYSPKGSVTREAMGAFLYRLKH